MGDNIINHSDLVRVIRDTNLFRIRNSRNTIMQSLRAGRCLEKIKSCVPYGEWGAWLDGNLDSMGYTEVYSNAVRAAQLDMQFWSSWQPYLAQLESLGVVSPDDNVEEQIVDNLTNNQVSVALSALQEFMKKGITETGFNMVLRHLEQNDTLSIHQAKTLAQISKAFDALPSQEARDAANLLFTKYGVTNPQVVQRIPDLLKNAPDILHEMLDTGHVYIPVADGKSLHVSLISETDLDIVLKNEDVERDLRRLQHIKESIAKRDAVRRDFDFVNRYEGTLDEILRLLKTVKAEKGATYQLSLYVAKNVV